jgi:hypothetical protein
MTDRITATGIESAFIESWSGWDEVETMCLAFYDCKIKDVFGIPTDVTYDVVNLDCNNNTVEVYSIDELVASRKFKIELIKENSDA